jgi:DeoR/GlpR family transcriptional regulator of sugar metabolism
LGASSMVLELAKTMVDKIDAELFITSAEGLSLEEGMTDFRLYEAEFKKLMTANARKTIALVDHTNDK